MKIRTKFWIAIACIVSISGITLLIYHVTLKHTITQYDNLFKTQNKIRMTAIDLMAAIDNSSKNVNTFILNKNPLYAQKAKLALKEADKDIDALATLYKAENDKEGLTNITTLKEYINRYAQTVNTLDDTLEGIGLEENEGLRGTFRYAIHNVESELAKCNLTDLYLTLQKIRRTEKNFILRHDAKYITQLKDLVNKFRDQIDRSGISDANKLKLTELVNNYYRSFNTFAQSILNGYETANEQNAQFQQYMSEMAKIIDKEHIPHAHLTYLQMRRDEKDFLARHKDKYLAKLEQDIHKLNECIKKSNLADKRKENLLTSLWTYKTILAGVIDGIRDIDKYSKELVNIEQKIAFLSENLKDRETRNIAKAQMAIGQSVKRATFFASLSGICSLILITIGGFLLTRMITKPTLQIVDFASKIASGTLTSRLDANRNDEFGDMIKALNKMADNFETIILRIANNADSLNNSSHQLSSTASNLADGASQMSSKSTTVAAAAEEMAINLSNMSTSTEQMTSNIKTVATAIEQIKDSIEEIAKNAGETSSVVSQASSLANDSNEKIAQLNTAADEIGKVIEVIQDIAEQTNLLALNATIEAARAGEAGKGFAVVANEVKELAKQTAEATEDIAKRIQAIQHSTTESVSSIGEIVKVIDHINEASQTIAAAVEEQSITTKEISENIMQATSASEVVSTNIGESASASKEVSQNISGIDTEAKKVAEGAAQAQAVSLEMSQISNQLQKFVNKFEVNKDKYIDMDADDSEQFIVWCDDFSVNVPEMDAQHQKLVRLVNQLYSAMKNKKSADKVGEIIDELAKYTVEHFGSEEEYMAKVNFPGLEKHKVVHQQFVKKVSEFEQEYMDGKVTLSIEIIEFLRDWLLNHIGKMDKQYGLQPV